MAIKHLLLGAAMSAALLASGVSLADEGETLYQANCAACHQLNGAGIPGAFPPLAKSDFLVEKGKEGAINNVLHGLSGELVVNGQTYNGVMPPMPQLSDEQVASILTYVFASWENEPTEVTAEDVAAIRAEQ